MSNSWLHCGAALALIGWYLMTPPVVRVCSPEGFPCTTQVQWGASISEWHIEGRYDTAEECGEKTDSWSWYWSNLRPQFGSIDAIEAAIDEHTQCIVSNDPRLPK